jgi:hypothetical protein
VGEAGWDLLEALAMGDSTPSQVTQTSQVKLSPEQQKIADLAFPYAQSYAEKPLQTYSGTGVAGFTPLEQQAQQGYVNGAAPTVGDLATKSADSQKMLLDPNFQLDVANNPYLRAAMNATTDQVTNNLQTRILPNLRSEGTAGSGMYSGASSRDAIREGQAIGDTNRNLGDTIAKTMLDAYTGGRASLQGAVQGNAAVQGQQLMAPDILGAVGGQERGMNQALLDEQIKNFYTQQKLPLLQAQELMGLISGMPGGTTVGQATGNVPKANPLLQGGGVLASILGLL